MDSFWGIADSINHIKKRSTSRFEESVDVSIVLHDSFKTNPTAYTSKMLGPYQPFQVAAVHMQTEPSLTQHHKHVELNINTARRAGIYVVDCRRFQPREIAVRKPEILLIHRNLSYTSRLSGMTSTKIVVAKDPIKSSLELISRKTSFYTIKDGSINASIGKLGFPFFILSENITRIVREVLKHKPDNVATNSYLKKVILSSTMSEGMHICLGSLKNL